MYTRLMHSCLHCFQTINSVVVVVVVVDYGDNVVLYRYMSLATVNENHIALYYCLYSINHISVVEHALALNMMVSIACPMR